ncbi:hypothetical protein G6M50_30355 [Agrobacterium rhizogenes]|nr:hypothetical protein [Rhizobium rhizogenes]NTJ82092.1 hypothetical protein [Rhizobium rhizogenes]
MKNDRSSISAFNKKQSRNEKRPGGRVMPFPQTICEENIGPQSPGDRQPIGVAVKILCFQLGLSRQRLQAGM